MARSEIDAERLGHVALSDDSQERFGDFPCSAHMLTMVEEMTGESNPGREPSACRDATKEIIRCGLD